MLIAQLDTYFANITTLPHAQTYTNVQNIECEPPTCVTVVTFTTVLECHAVGLETTLYYCRNSWYSSIFRGNGKASMLRLKLFLFSECVSCESRMRNARKYRRNLLAHAVRSTEKNAFSSAGVRTCAALWAIPSHSPYELRPKSLPFMLKYFYSPRRVIASFHVPSPNPRQEIETVSGHEYGRRKTQLKSICRIGNRKDVQNGDCRRGTHIRN